MLVVTPRCCNVISVGRFICGGPSDGLLKLSSIDVLLIRAATADWYIRSERWWLSVLFYALWLTPLCTALPVLFPNYFLHVSHIFFCNSLRQNWSHYGIVRTTYVVTKCLSVCLSVTCWYCVKTAKSVVRLFSPSGSHTILVFCTKHYGSVMTGTPLQGVLKYRNCRQISRCISEMIQDTAIVTMKCE